MEIAPGLVMAVYTPISDSQLRSALAGFGLTLAGPPEGVSQGIENTTYFFRATGDGGLRDYVLTLVENTPAPQIDFSAALAAHLADAGLPVPAPIATRQGLRVFPLAGKPGLIFPRLQGEHPLRPEASTCAIIGNFLGRAHHRGAAFSQTLANARGLPWLVQASAVLAKSLSAQDKALLETQLRDYRQLCNTRPALPSGPIHGDLFRDNTLFCAGQLSGVIDFFNACSDWLLIDLAIAVNDWCSHSNGDLDPELTDALLGAYQRIRPFTPGERRHWQALLCFAATRFWVSRLLAQHSPELPGDDAKDPEEYRRLVLARRQRVLPLPQ